MTAVIEGDLQEQPAATAPGPGRNGVDRTLAAILFLGSVAVRLPFQADFLVNFDAVNFAFGVEGFDLEGHEPHPPGYLGYVLAARIVNGVVDDPNRSLTLLSVVSSGAAVMFLYALCRRFADRVASVLVAALFSVSALAWYYGIVALSYMPATAITLALVVVCHRARFDRNAPALYWAAVVLAALGALRQTDVALFLPLVVYAAVSLPWRVRLRAAGLFVALVMAWLIPLLWLSGGPSEYLELSRDLATLAGGSTSVFSPEWSGLLTNFRLVVSGVVTATLSVLPLLLIGKRAAFGREASAFLALWALPALLVFLFIHTGQVGYVLPIVAVVHVVVARMVSMWRLDHTPRRASQRARVVGAGALLVGLSLAVSAAGPRWVVQTMRGDGSAGVRDISIPLVGEFELPAPHRVRPISVSVHDTHWRAVLARVGETDPDEAVLFARLDGSARFRPLTYYVRDHVVYTVGRGRDGGFGSIFVSHGGDTNYSVDGLSHPSAQIALPDEVTDVMIFDLPPDRLRTPLPTMWETIADGTTLVTLTVPPGAELSLSTTSNDEWVIEPEETP